MSYTTLDDVLARLSQVTENNGKYMACCPAHDDKTPSLQLWAGDYKPVIAKCYGCDAREDEVLTALGIEPRTNRYDRTNGNGLAAIHIPRTAHVAVRRTSRVKPTVPDAWVADKDAKPTPPCVPPTYNALLAPYVRGGDLSTPVAAYHYQTPQGGHAYTVVRYTPKNFRQFVIDENGEMQMGFAGVERELYRLGAVRDAAKRNDWVVFVDGEKDADILAARNYIATCIAGGGKGTYPNNISEMMDGCKLAIVIDKDQAGIESAKRLYDTVKEHVVEVKFVVMPDHDTYFIKDVADYFNAGGDDATFIAAVNAGMTPARFHATYYPESTESASETPPNVLTNATTPVQAATSPTEGALPQVLLPAGGVTYTQSAAALGDLMARTGRYFNRGGVLVRIERNGTLAFREVKFPALPSAFEEVATLVKITNEGVAPALCSKATAEVILNATTFMAPIPEVKGVSKVPVLVVNAEGRLVATRGYCPISKMYSEGDAPTLMPVQDAVAIIEGALSDFRFSTQGDKARAIAAIITPAAIRGGLLRGRAPFDLGEADGSQSGKSYRHKLTAAMYNERVDVITQSSSRGLGNIEESISAKLLAGNGFISIDNMRGKLDSPMIEAMATEDTILCRVAYSAPQTVDPSKVTLQATSNKADITRDLANRSSVVRIRHQGFDYQWKQYPEGDILDHIRANQPKYYSAIYTVLNAWVEAGRPLETVTDHSFKAWAGSIGWITKNLFNTGDLLAGHKEVQDRMTSPHLGWARELAIAATKGLVGIRTEWLRTNDLLELCLDNDLEIPGFSERDNPDDEETRKRVLQAMGRRLSRVVPKDKVAVDVDGYRIYRYETNDDKWRRKVSYAVEPITETTPAMATLLIGGNPVTTATYNKSDLGV